MENEEQKKAVSFREFMEEHKTVSIIFLSVIVYVAIVLLFIFGNKLFSNSGAISQDLINRPQYNPS